MSGPTGSLGSSRARTARRATLVRCGPSGTAEHGGGEVIALYTQSLHRLFKRPIVREDEESPNFNTEAVCEPLQHRERQLPLTPLDASKIRLRRPRLPREGFLRESEALAESDDPRADTSREAVRRGGHEVCTVPAQSVQVASPTLR